MISFFSVSFFSTLCAIPILQQIAGKYHLYDVAEGDALKIHKKPISYLGGVALLFGVSVGMFWASIQEPAYRAPLWLAWVGSVLIFGFGFWDDVAWKHISKRKPYAKFAGLLLVPALVAMMLMLAGFGFQFFPAAFLIGLLTFLYIFLGINALNYQDGMDGLAGGLTCISAGGFFILASLQGNWLAAFLATLLLGVGMAFLAFNFPPAKIFMGDSGAYLFGFLLVMIALLLSKPFHIPLLIGPACIIGVPIVDGIFTNARRLFARKSIFLGDRAHLYDRLLQRGFSQRKTLAIVCLLQAIFVVFGVIISLQETI